MTSLARELAERQEAERREVGERLVEVPDERASSAGSRVAASTSSSWWSAPLHVGDAARVAAARSPRPAKPTEKVFDRLAPCAAP